MPDRSDSKTTERTDRHIFGVFELAAMNAFEQWRAQQPAERIAGLSEQQLIALYRESHGSKVSWL